MLELILSRPHHENSAFMRHRRAERGRNANGEANEKWVWIDVQIHRDLVRERRKNNCRRRIINEMGEKEAKQQHKPQKHHRLSPLKAAYGPMGHTPDSTRFLDRQTERN